MKILACGSRDWDDEDKLKRTLLALNWGMDITELIHGGARGADQMSGQWADGACLLVTEVLPDWNRHGRSAGFVRNIEMLDMLEEGDVVIAFWDGQSRGTMHTVDNAVERGHLVLVVR